MRVCRMRLATQAVDDPHLNPSDRGKSSLVQLGNIRRIRKGSDPHPEGHIEAMVLREWHNRHTGDLERPDDCVCYKGGLVKAPRLLRSFERVSEPTLDFCQRLPIGV